MECSASSIRPVGEIREGGVLLFQFGLTTFSRKSEAFAAEDIKKR